jgi:hypothetical protein
VPVSVRLGSADGVTASLLLWVAALLLLALGRPAVAVLTDAASARSGTAIASAGAVGAPRVDI